MSDIRGNVNSRARLQPDTYMSGLLDFDGDTDWFRISMKSGLTYEIDLSSSGLADGADEVQLLFRDALGRIVDSDGGGWYQNRSLLIQGNGLAFVEVTSRGAIGSYVVHLDTADTVKDNVDTRQNLIIGGQKAGVIDSKADGDWYGLRVTAGVTYTISVQGDGIAGELQDPSVAIRNGFGTVVAQSFHAWGGVAEIVWTAEESGRFFVSVGEVFAEGWSFGADTGSFVIEVTSDQRNVIGTRKNDALTGGDTANYMSGALGDDSLSGAAGNDTIFGGVGDDVLAGDAGNDRLVGGAGADTLVGGADADTIVGGLGDDRLFGGGGRDRFVFHNGAGRDVIADFEDGIDRIVLGGSLTFDDVSIRQGGPNAVVAVSDFVIVLQNTLAQELTRADFAFI